MQIHIITLFPDMFQALSHGIVGRAQKQQLINLHYWNPRDFTKDTHRTVDDRPYGGGPGMIMMTQPLRDAIQAAKQACPQPCKVIYLSPQGQTLNQTVIQQFSNDSHLIFIAGRYEGIDERLIQHDIDEEWSVGDYIVSGGELPAMLVVDAITRLLPGALGHDQSAEQDSFSNGLLDYPHFTRPESLDGQNAPKILLSGDHAAIARWRHQQSLGNTWQKRPDLLKRRVLTAEEQTLLDEFRRDEE